MGTEEQKGPGGDTCCVCKGLLRKLFSEKKAGEERRSFSPCPPLPRSLSSRRAGMQRWLPRCLTA